MESNANGVAPGRWEASSGRTRPTTSSGCAERCTSSTRSRASAGGPEIDDLYRQNTREHRAITGAIEARSAEGARALAHEHVLHSCRLLEVILDHLAPSAA